MKSYSKIFCKRVEEKKKSIVQESVTENEKRTLESELERKRLREERI